MWMNEYDVETAAARYTGHPVLGPATRTLASLVSGVNACSDGWPYWKAPSRAAARLVNLIEAHQTWERTGYQIPRDGSEATADRLQAAYTALKRFRTQHPQCQFRLFPADGVTNADPEPEPLPAELEVVVMLRGDGTAGFGAVWPGSKIPQLAGVYQGKLSLQVSEQS